MNKLSTRSVAVSRTNNSIRLFPGKCKKDEDDDAQSFAFSFLVVIRQAGGSKNPLEEETTDELMAIRKKSQRETQLEEGTENGC